MSSSADSKTSDTPVSSAEPEAPAVPTSAGISEALLAKRKAEIREEEPVVFTVPGIDGVMYDSKELFKRVDITVLNFWGTYCGPCKYEMPELGKWKQEGMQVVGVVTDINGANDREYIDYANRICDELGAHYVNLIPADGDLLDALDELYCVPTTVYINSDGQPIGDTVYGVDLDAYKDYVNYYLYE